MSGTPCFNRWLEVTSVWPVFAFAACNSGAEDLFPEVARDELFQEIPAQGTESVAVDEMEGEPLDESSGELVDGAAKVVASPDEPRTIASQGDAGAVEPALPVVTHFVLDDFEDGDGLLSSEGFSGSWHTYSDGSGSVTPAVNGPVVPESGALHVHGGGFSSWGVGLSVDLDDSSGQRVPVDLSGYDGLFLRARGTGSVVVELVLPATTGMGEVGGTCNGNCFGHYSATLTLSAEYTEQTLAFAAFKQPAWATVAELDLTQVLAINFLSPPNGGAANIDLWLDEVSVSSGL